MTRNRASAKQAGTAFETSIANYLARTLNDDRIERRAKNGNKDRGDVGGVRHLCQRIVVETKNYGGRILPGPWCDEADVERGNDDAVAGFVIAKRRGTTNPADQFVICTVGNWVALMNGNRDHLDAPQSVSTDPSTTTMKP